MILDFDEASDAVFFVLSGGVRVAVRSPGGAELILGDIGPGGFFGEMAAIDGLPRSACVTALHRSFVCRLAGAQFMELVTEAPALARDLLRVLAARLRDANARLLDFTTLGARHRVYAELLRSARASTTGDERVISPPPSQQVIASRIGLRREAVSREVARLIRDGMLERRRGGLVITRPAVLEAELAPLLSA
ncbi:Crp/Fnr family transcriptional regulator [Roseomonas sp. CCTCC AB2023176]|uniref:Crp/Fnr family transcriptional regulator n=1 Tax=Roseomonas sp. CCTCC AB2023176 TaxID=3342640 RepID=UPI0035D8C1B0